MTDATTITFLKAELATAKAKAAEAESKAAEAEARAVVAGAKALNAEAKVSDAEAEIAFLKLTIEKLRRELYGCRSERKQRLLDQLELQLDDLEATATEDDLAAEQAAAQTTQVKGFTRRKPKRKPFPAHLPRERVVVPAPETCACCGSDKLSKIGRGCHRNAGGYPAPMESDPDRAREVHLPVLREDQPAAGTVPCDTEGLGGAQSAGNDAV